MHKPWQNIDGIKWNVWTCNLFFFFNLTCEHLLTWPYPLECPVKHIHLSKLSNCAFHFQKLSKILFSLNNPCRSRCFLLWTTTIPSFFCSWITHIQNFFLHIYYILVSNLDCKIYLGLKMWLIHFVSPWCPSQVTLSSSPNYRVNIW